MEVKIILEPGERCPYCGQRKRKKKTMTEKATAANRQNVQKAIAGRKAKQNSER